MLKYSAFLHVFSTLSVVFFFSHSSILRLNPADIERVDLHRKPVSSSFLDLCKTENRASSGGIC